MDIGYTVLLAVYLKASPPSKVKVGMKNYSCRCLSQL